MKTLHIVVSPIRNDYTLCQFIILTFETSFQSNIRVYEQTDDFTDCACANTIVQLCCILQSISHGGCLWRYKRNISCQNVVIWPEKYVWVELLTFNSPCLRLRLGVKIRLHISGVKFQLGNCLSLNEKVKDIWLTADTPLDGFRMGDCAELRLRCVPGGYHVAVFCDEMGKISGNVVKGSGNFIFIRYVRNLLNPILSVHGYIYVFGGNDERAPHND